MEEQNIDTLVQHMEQLEAKVDKVLEHVDETKKSDMKGASKPVMAAALGLVGAKLGGLLGAKIGWVTKLVQRSCEEGFVPAIQEGLLISPNTMDDKGKFSFDNFFAVAQEQSTHIGIGAMVGAVVVGTAAAGVGWFRGDRLENAFDLIKHPINSIDRLRISDDNFAKKYPEHAEKMKTWQNKVELPAEKEKAGVMI